MKARYLIGGALLATCSTLVLAGPTSLLPPGFEQPTPAPAPAPTPSPAPTPAPSATPAPSSGSTSQPVVQATTGGSSNASASGSEDGSDSDSDGPRLKRLPSVQELERMSPEAFNELFDLNPEYDVPPTARRSLDMVGVIDAENGGLPGGSLASQPAALVRAALAGNTGRLTSRWGHILLRRALASRMDAPDGMGGVEFAALRAGLLNRMGENAVARTLVQDVDSANYNGALASAAVDAFVGTGDIVGICPVARLKTDALDSDQWNILKQVCAAYANDGRRANRELRRYVNNGKVPQIDALLAQRFAGASGESGQAVNIEWDDVEELTPWRYGFASALGIDFPDELWNGSNGAFDAQAAISPAMPLDRRLQASAVSAARGVMSASALVDLYSQAYADAESLPDWTRQARSLRRAYVDEQPAERLNAIRSLWDDDRVGSGDVLTAYASARMTPSGEFAADADRLIGSMLTAGLDRNAMRWASVVDEGSIAWGLLALAQPNGDTAVDEGSVRDFVGNDESADQRRSGFLVAGLAGLGRLDGDAVSELDADLGLSLGRRTKWSNLIDASARVDNQALVALLAGLGMQGESWDKMTPRHLYHIVRALNDVGLSAEARMIAAEAVAKG